MTAPPQNAKPVDVTSYDIVKAIAVVTMICDHIGFYFFPENPWWRVIGRVSVPVWFFLPGFSDKRTIEPRLWIGGLLLTLGNLIIGLPVFPLDTLVTILLIRLGIDSIAPLSRKNMLEFCGVMLGLMLVFIPSSTFFEYGSLAFIIATFGWLVKHRRGERLTALFGLFAFAAWTGLQELNFLFSPPQLLVMAALSGLTIYSLYRFQPRVLPKAQPAWLLKFMGRRTLEIYVIHLLLFKAAVLYTHPHNFLQLGLFTTNASWG